MRAATGASLYLRPNHPRAHTTHPARPHSILHLEDLSRPRSKDDARPLRGARVPGRERKVRARVVSPHLRTRLRRAEMGGQRAGVLTRLLGRRRWDYDGLMVSWGVQDNYEVVRKVGRGKVSLLVWFPWSRRRGRDARTGAPVGSRGARWARARGTSPKARPTHARRAGEFAKIARVLPVRGQSDHPCLEHLSTVGVGEGPAQGTRALSGAETTVAGSGCARSLPARHSLASTGEQ